MDPWLVLIGPGAGRRKEAAKRAEGAAGRGWGGMAAARAEEELPSRGAEEESDAGCTERVEVRGDGAGLKGGEMNVGARGGLTRSF